MCVKNAIQTLPSHEPSLELCTSEKLHVFHVDDCLHFLMKEAVKLSIMALITISLDGHILGHHVTNI